MKIKMNVRVELMKELKAIYNNKDFVCGTSSILGYENTREKMLDFIRKARKQGDSITSDNILRLAMVLRDEEDEKRNGQNKRTQFVAAML